MEHVESDDLTLAECRVRIVVVYCIGLFLVGCKYTYRFLYYEIKSYGPV